MNKIISYIKKHPFLGAAVVFIGGVFICIEYGRCFPNSKGCDISVAQYIGTFISAVATACMAWIAYEGNKQNEENAKIAKASADAAQKQADTAIQSLQEAQKQREEAWRPRLIVHFERKPLFALQLIVENVGNAPAYDVDVSVKAPWEPYKKNEAVFLIWHTLKQKCAYLACGEKVVLTHNEWNNFYTCTPIQLFLMQVKPLEVNLKYHGGTREKPFEETPKIYLSDQVSGTTDQTGFPPFLSLENQSSNACRKYIEAFLRLFEHYPAFDFSIPKYIENVTRDLVYIQDLLKETRTSSQCAHPDVYGIFKHYNAFIEKIEKQIGQFNEERGFFYNIPNRFFCRASEYALELLLPHLYNKVYFLLEKQIREHPDTPLSISAMASSEADTFEPEEIKKLLARVDQVHREPGGEALDKINKIFEILANKQNIKTKEGKQLDTPVKELSDMAQGLCGNIENVLEDFLKNSFENSFFRPSVAQKLKELISRPTSISKENSIPSICLCGEHHAKDTAYTLSLIYIACEEFKGILDHLYDLYSCDKHLHRIQSTLTFDEEIYIDKRPYLEQALKRLAIDLSNTMPNVVSIDPTRHFVFSIESIGEGVVDEGKIANSTKLFNPKSELTRMYSNRDLFSETLYILQKFFKEYKELDSERCKTFRAKLPAKLRPNSDA